MGPRDAPAQPAVETRKTYATSVRQLDAHERAHGRTTLIDEITAFHIRSYLVGVLEQAGVIGRADYRLAHANSAPFEMPFFVWPDPSPAATMIWVAEQPAVSARASSRS